AFFGLFVQPVQCGAMLFCKPVTYPNNRDCIQPGSICEYLTKMRVIGSFQLVFNHHPLIRRGIFAKNVGAKWTDRFLLCLTFKLKADSFIEECEVFRLCEPRSELRRFLLPCLT